MKQAVVTYNQLPVEKRRQIRLACDIAVRCLGDSGEFTATVRDISRQGMRLEAPRPLDPASQLRVARPLSELSPIQVHVAWCRPLGQGFEAGVVCGERSQSSWLEEALGQLAGAEVAVVERRNFRRAQVNLPAQVSTDGQACPVHLRSLGLGGALLETFQELEMGTRVELTLGEGEAAALCRGRVVHVRSAGLGWLCGLSFGHLPRREASIVEGYVVEALGE